MWLWWAGSFVAHAHSLRPAVFNLQEYEPGQFEVVWVVHSPAGPHLENDILPSMPPRCATLGEVRSDRGPTRKSQWWRIDCSGDRLVGSEVSFPGLEFSSMDVVVRVGWADGGEVVGFASRDSPVYVVATPSIGTEPSQDSTWSHYLRLGVEHILGGLDHLLFVFGLLLLVRRPKMLAATVTAFTAAHSLTLGLAISGWVVLPSAPVEVCIALSIVLLAVELTHKRPTLTRRFPWGVAFGFGLLHGLGFAGALADLGLPEGRLIPTLVSFNVGVEVGQLAFLAAAWFPVRGFAWAESRWPWVAQLLPYAIGIVAVVWVIERLWSW